MVGAAKPLTGIVHIGCQTPDRRAYRVPKPLCIDIGFDNYPPPYAG